MNFKSTLWALAFACAAVSCSDDLENGPNNNEGNEEQGEGVYLTVNIASSSKGAMTKADNPAEDGSTDPLQGTAEERKIHNINIYLIKASDIDSPTSISSEEDGVTIASASENIEIVGHGYSEDITETGHISDHTANTVMIEIDQKDIQASEVNYYVFAVANLGKKVSFSTLGNLRNAVKAPSDSGTDWDGKVWKGTATYGNATNFVMSTHQMYDSNIQEPSSVTISTANMDPNNPATATVYVERLAARIDLKTTETLKTKEEVDHPVIVDGTPNAKDYVKLTGYQVVNRWNGENYMLKRVTTDLSRNDANSPYPSIPSPLENVKYLGDEIWSDATTFKYNYVIDPKTTAKKMESNVTPDAIKSSYQNHYDAGLNNTIATAFTGLTNISTTEFTPVIYTKENTLDLNNQVLGLITGVIFKGEYTPNKVSQFTTTGGEDDQTSEVEAVAYTEGDDFYVVNDFMNEHGSRFLCRDLKTIGVLAFENIKDQIYSSDLLKALFDDQTQAWGSVSLDNLKAAIAGITGGKLSAAYKEFLESAVNRATSAPGAKNDITDVQLESVKWSQFLTTKSISDPGTTQSARDSKTLYDTWNISYYDGGVCYYPYWIRHENNGNDAVSAPMEFCIVRNNVYQLNITGVNALGYPLPFTTPEDTPAEKESVFLNVEIYVKHWVVRSNDNIIL